MGWLFTHDSHRSTLVTELTSDRNWTRDDGSKWTAKVVKHCYRGNNFSGVLWVVWSVSIDGQEKDRFIECNLLRFDKKCNGWGYKDMDESMGPYYYSCPLGYLELVPELNPEWREGVRTYHETRKHRRISSRQGVSIL